MESGHLLLSRKFELKSHRKFEIFQVEDNLIIKSSCRPVADRVGKEGVGYETMVGTDCQLLILQTDFGYNE